MEIKDFEGFVKQTISRTTLYPNQKTRGHTHEDANETYYFIAGNGLILLQSVDLNELFHIESETWLYIPKKTFHMVINTSKNENLEFMTFYPGPSARPPITRKRGKEEEMKYIIIHNITFFINSNIFMPITDEAFCKCDYETWMYLRNYDNTLNFDEST